MSSFTISTNNFSLRKKLFGHTNHQLLNEYISYNFFFIKF